MFESCRAHRTSACKPADRIRESGSAETHLAPGACAYENPPVRRLLALAAALVIPCSLALADTRPRATDAQVSRAYYGAPLITNRQARAVPFGITPNRLYSRLHGYSPNAQSRARGRNWKICVTYPVRGTGVKDKRFGVVADEWLFCFEFNNKLKRKFF